MSGYAKLFGTLISSVEWQLPPLTRIVWLTMLASAERDGTIVGSVPGIARLSNLPIIETETALKHLLEPDTYSKEPGGIRMVETPSGWKIVNFEKYLAMIRESDRREYLRRYQSRRRAKLKLTELEKAGLEPPKVNPVNSDNVDKAHLPGLAPAPEPPKPAAPKGPTPEGVDFVDWFLLLLNRTGGRIPPLTDAITARWAKVYEDLIRLDHRDPQEIKLVCSWARNDPFWRSNFLSPVKLRDKKDDIPYYDHFLNKMRDGTGRKKTALA